MGIPSQSSGSDSIITLQGAGAWSLVRKLRSKSCKPCGVAKKKKKDNLIVLGIFLAPLQCLVNQGEPWNQSCSSYMSQEPKAQSRLYLQPMSLTLSTQLDIMVIWSTWILKNSFHQDHIVLEVVHYSPRPETKAFILKRPNQGLVYPLNSLRHSQMPEDAFRRNKTPK